MNVESILQAVSQQQGVNVHGDGITRTLRATRTGQLFTADWKTELVLSGAAYAVSVGDIAAGAAESLITGGGAGTTIDTDQPELAVGTPTGHYHIPLGFTFGGRADLDADGETCEVLLFADTAKTLVLPIAASSTVETPANLLGGGPAAVSVAQSAVTTDIADPVCSMILAFKSMQAAAAAAGQVNPDLSLQWFPPFPILLKGPCSVIGCWGGTAAVTGAATYYFAEVPIARFE